YATRRGSKDQPGPATARSRRWTGHVPAPARWATAAFRVESIDGTGGPCAGFGARQRTLEHAREESHATAWDCRGAGSFEDRQPSARRGALCQPDELRG